VKLLSNLPCEDGDACTVDDQCFDGECVAGPSSCEPGTPDNPAESCLAIQTAKPDAGDGLYWLIAPAAEAVAFQVYCDMTTQGGGWSRVANIQGEVPVCSYSDGYGAESAVYQNEGTTGIMPLSIAGAIPFEGEILVRVAGVDYHFSSAHPAWSWSAVASGTITTLNVAAYQVQSAVNGVASGGVGYTSACTKIGSCLLGGAHAGTTDWGVVLGIGAYFTGTHKQDAACLTQSALKGLFTGPVAGGGGWGSTGQIYLR
jgi:hypothetical protein